MSSLTRFCFALAATLFLGLTFSAFQPVQAQSTTVVISELRTRGPGTTGLANGTGNDDFVEITNVSGGLLDISGYQMRGWNARGAAPRPGGLANGPGNDDFVEITNVSGGLLDISGYKLRGSNAAGTIGDRATASHGVVIRPR